MLYYIYIYFRVMSEKKKHFYTTCLEFANLIHLKISMAIMDGNAFCKKSVTGVVRDQQMSACFPAA